ncbi:hypothetical protein [Pelosinus fermentans]|uniref:Uncharacterized protein n=1 Tax=Pelosinus fermentans JBW45 TaxID=1192197 RepID=I9DMA2_9FIRM|nr:hypothetical protein [Pelosinus fermentans]AJQ27504.1 hypothetical protein JBW_02154 [Pelosinus fermentans JBW45]
MKAITILQPWASLFACGAKQIETANVDPKLSIGKRKKGIV